MIDLRLKYGTNNIPILSNETIDEHAELLIGDYDSNLLSKPQAIDVEDFAENYLGLHFHFTDLSHSGFIWGRMVFNDAKIIIYNPDTKRPDEEPVEGSTIVIRSHFKTAEKEQGTTSAVLCGGHSSCHHRQSDLRLCAGGNRTAQGTGTEGEQEPEPHLLFGNAEMPALRSKLYAQQAY